MKLRLLPIVPAVLAILASPPTRAEVIHATADADGQARLVQIVREGDNIFIPLFACGSLLAVEARWNQSTNQWELRGKNIMAQGFLDEPLVSVSGQPFIVRVPPRLIERSPYLSLEVMRLLGRHGWETDVAWEPSTKELFIRPAQAQPTALSPRGRTLALPTVPEGNRIIGLDPGHPRQAGIQASRGGTEGDFGLRICTALSATLAILGGAPVVLRGEGDDLTPAEVASLANAVRSDFMVSLHGSYHGSPGITVWCWGLQNMVGSGINFIPFEPPGGWTQAALASSVKSSALARKLVKSLNADGIPVRGPFAAPLACLEGVVCPAVVLDFEGLSTAEGASLVNNEQRVNDIAAAAARVLMAGEGGPARPAAQP